ncbi:MAG: iron-sulfur cluster assembly scaffold protein [Patescibacteria group bacterium]|jgi:nitrogen fixation NifU-like protein
MSPRAKKKTAAPPRATANTDIEAMYRENILDHYRSPRNFGELPHPSFRQREANFSCGDDVDIQVLVDQKQRISKVMFNGRGCAVSQAAASLLTENAVGLTLVEASRLGLSDIAGWLGVDIGPARIKCATLALKALQAGITDYQKNHGL